MGIRTCCEDMPTLGLLVFLSAALAPTVSFRTAVPSQVAPIISATRRPAFAPHAISTPGALCVVARPSAPRQSLITMGIVKETPLRSFVKAAGWRFTAGLVTAASSFIFTGSLATAASIVGKLFEEEEEAAVIDTPEVVAAEA